MAEKARRTDRSFSVRSTLPPLFDRQAYTNVRTELLAILAGSGPVGIEELAEHFQVSRQSIGKTCRRLASLGLVRLSTNNGGNSRRASICLNAEHLAYPELLTLLDALRRAYQLASLPTLALKRPQGLTEPLRLRVDELIGLPPISRTLILVALMGEAQLGRLAAYLSIRKSAMVGFGVALRRYNTLGILDENYSPGQKGERVSYSLSRKLPVREELKSFLLKLGELLEVPRQLNAINMDYERQLTLSKTKKRGQKNIIFRHPELFFKDDA
jgi:hypothetical protein